MALGVAIGRTGMNQILSRSGALFLLAVVVVMWGSNWAVTKTLVLSVSPLWATAIRSAIATVTLFVFLLARRQLIMPRRGDVPVVLTVAVLHMGGFSALVAFGLQLVSVGRSIVLAPTLGGSCCLVAFERTFDAMATRGSWTGPCWIGVDVQSVDVRLERQNRVGR
jgi:hypothetical protein